MAVTPQHRAARRRTARQIETGTYKPSNIGKKAREAARLKLTRDEAHKNVKLNLGPYHKYNDTTVKANIYGGTTAESGKVTGMSLEQAEWTRHADTEELRSRASSQYRANPWWYH
jgi:hypothetical protein